MFGIWLLVLLAAERYIAIVHPFRAATWCRMGLIKKVILLIFLASFVFNIPAVIDVNFLSNNDEFMAFPSTSSFHRLFHAMTAYYQHNPKYFWGYHVIVKFVVYFIVPFIIIGATNACVLSSLIKSARLRSGLRRQALGTLDAIVNDAEAGVAATTDDVTIETATSNRERGRHTDGRYLTMMCFGTFLSFIICYLPGCVANCILVRELMNTKIRIYEDMELEIIKINQVSSLWFVL